MLGGSAIVVMGALAGCSSTSTKEEPKTTSTPLSSSASSAPEVSPTEKSVGGGPSSFSPTIKPPNPSLACARVVNGVCQHG